MTKNPDLLVKLNNAGANISSKWLVRGVSFELFKGQILTLIGPNGSGKTTTAKMVLNILNADEGSIEIHTNKLAYVPQKLNIDWTLPLRVADFMNITSKISVRMQNNTAHIKISHFLPHKIFQGCDIGHLIPIYM